MVQKVSQDVNEIIKAVPVHEHGDEEYCRIFYVPNVLLINTLTELGDHRTIYGLLDDTCEVRYNSIQELKDEFAEDYVRELEEQLAKQRETIQSLIQDNQDMSSSGRTSFRRWCSTSRGRRAVP